MPVSILRLFATLLAVVMVGIGPSHAQGAGWRLSEVSGVVRILQPGAALAPGTRGQALAVGSTVTTGANGSATIENGAQRIVIAGNSRTTIAPDTGSGMSRILQDVGTALFEVDRRTAPHFRVETPLLAAVVKGTTFTVTAGPQEDVVHVARGLVAVSANGGTAMRDVAAGETARVLQSSPGQLALAAPAPSGANVLAGVTLPAIDYVEASGRVIDGAVTRGAADTRASNAQSNSEPSERDSGDTGGIGGVISLAINSANNAPAGAGNSNSGSGANTGAGGNDSAAGGANDGSSGGGAGNGNSGGNTGNGSSGNGNSGGNSGGGGGNSGGNSGGDNGNSGGNSSGGNGNSGGNSGSSGNSGGGSGSGNSGGNSGGDNGNSGGNSGGSGNSGGGSGNGNSGGNSGGGTGNGNSGGNSGGGNGNSSGNGGGGGSGKSDGGDGGKDPD
jgi:hypothetical protein